MLGGFQEDAVAMLGPVVGADRVTAFLTSFKAAIRTEAGIGAKTAVKPYVLVAMTLGGLGFVMGAAAFLRSRR